KQDPTCSRFGDTTQDLEQSAFSGAVAPDDAYHLALLDLKSNILECPKLLNLIALRNLTTPDKVGRFAREIADLPLNDVAQRRILVLAIHTRSMTEQIALR